MGFFGKKCFFSEKNELQQAERYKIHPAKPGPKGLKDSCSTHTKMQAGGWQRETSDNSTWSSWASPVAKFFSSGWQWPTASAAGPTASWAAEPPGRSEHRWRAPFDGPWQGRAEGRGRCARGSRPNRQTGMAKRTVVGCRQREAWRERAEAMRAGGWSGSGGTAWAKLGEARQGREDTQRAGGWSRWAHAVEGNQIRSHHEQDLRRTQRHTPPYTVPRSRSPLARGRVETPVLQRASSATRPFSHTFPHTVPCYCSPLARGRTSNPPCEAGVGTPASPRASSATRTLSPPRFVSSSLVSSRFVSSSFVSSSAPPSRPSSDRGGRQGGAPPASFLTSSVARSPSEQRLANQNFDDEEYRIVCKFGNTASHRASCGSRQGTSISLAWHTTTEHARVHTSCTRTPVMLLSMQAEI